MYSSIHISCLQHVILSTISNVILADVLTRRLYVMDAQTVMMVRMNPGKCAVSLATFYPWELVTVANSEALDGGV